MKEQKKTLEIVESFDDAYFNLENILAALKALSSGCKNEKEDIQRETITKVIDLLINNMDSQLENLFVTGEHLHQLLQEERKG